MQPRFSNLTETFAKFCIRTGTTAKYSLYFTNVPCTARAHAVQVWEIILVPNAGTLHSMLAGSWVISFKPGVKMLSEMSRTCILRTVNLLITLALSHEPKARETFADFCWLRLSAVLKTVWWALRTFPTCAT